MTCIHAGNANAHTPITATRFWTRVFTVGIILLWDDGSRMRLLSVRVDNAYKIKNSQYDYHLWALYIYFTSICGYPLTSLPLLIILIVIYILIYSRLVNYEIFYLKIKKIPENEEENICFLAKQKKKWFSEKCLRCV